MEMTARLALAGVAMFMFVEPVSARYLTGKDRDDFVRSSTMSCVRGKDKYEITRNMSTSALEGYCSCYSNGIADKLTMNQLRTGTDAEVDPVVAVVGTACIRTMKEKATK